MWYVEYRVKKSGQTRVTGVPCGTSWMGTLLHNVISKDEWRNGPVAESCRTVVLSWLDRTGIWRATVTLHVNPAIPYSRHRSGDCSCVPIVINLIVRPPDGTPILTDASQKRLSVVGGGSLRLSLWCPGASLRQLLYPPHRSGSSRNRPAAPMFWCPAPLTSTS